MREGRVVSGIGWRLPARLRPLSDRTATVLRLGWAILFLFGLCAAIAATVYVVRTNYQTRPKFEQLGLDYHVEYEGDVLFGTLPDANGRQRIPVSSHIVAIDGRPVAETAVLAELSQRVDAAPGPHVAVDLRLPTGRVVHLQTVRHAIVPTDAAAERGALFRLATRLMLGLSACTTLLMCSLILALRRPKDPVAMLFAFAFAGMAATIDPPLQMWMGLGVSVIDDVIASAWFYLLLIAFCVFPDGIFVPKPYRFLLVLGLPVAVFLSLEQVNENLQMVIGIGTLLAILTAQIRRYRRETDGIARQQIKYAAFGFALGLLLIGAAMVIIAGLPGHGEASPWWRLIVLALFSVGMATIPLGLLVALTRFRLWEADMVISRSAAYAVVTLVVGAVWAASSDLVKMFVAQVLGSDSSASATAVSAVLAAAVFTPTQSVVLGWTKRRFGGPLGLISGAGSRLKKWSLTEPPEEIATRALGIIDNTIHPSAAAIVVDTPRGRELLAARGTDRADDSRLIEHLELADEESLVGELLLSRRSDGNRYNRGELEAIHGLIPPLAEALRVSRSRQSHDSQLQARFEEMAARLAQLEGGGAPKPA